MYDHRRWDLSHWLGFDTLCMYDTVNTLASRGYIECCGVTHADSGIVAITHHDVVYLYAKYLLRSITHDAMVYMY